MRVPSRTLRFSERAGLLPEPRRAANGYYFHESTVARVWFISAAQAAGLTLVEVR